MLVVIVSFIQYGVPLTLIVGAFSLWINGQTDSSVCRPNRRDQVMATATKLFRTASVSVVLTESLLAITSQAVVISRLIQRSQSFTLTKTKRSVISDKTSAFLRSWGEVIIVINLGMYSQLIDLERIQIYLVFSPLWLFKVHYKDNIVQRKRSELFSSAALKPYNNKQTR